MADSNITLFGLMPNGERVEQIVLKSGELECGIISYGGALRYLRVPNAHGGMTDVLLGFDSLEDYIRQDKYIGALIGRYANRIGKARFELNGTAYPLYANNGANHLHGGKCGFDKRVWSVDSADESSVRLSLTSADGEEGYPGELNVCVEYRLRGATLEIGYNAVSSKDTVCNLTNHAYFNLSGHDSGTVYAQELQLLADLYTPADRESIPTGELAEVTGTPMDLREPMCIGEHIDDEFSQLLYAGGYDHNWLINGGGDGELHLAAKAYSPQTGICMETLTTMPGIQFYSGNYLDGAVVGKNGASYGRRSAFCLETQYYPDSPNRSDFPSAVLKAGERYHHMTQYRFSVK